MVQTSCSIVPKEIRFIQDEADSSDDWKEVLLNGEHLIKQHCIVHF